MTQPDVNEVSSPGGKVGGRIARLVADASVHARQQMADHTTRVGNKIFTDVTNHVSDEVRSVMGPIFAEVANHPDTPEDIKPLMRQLAEGRGQAWAWIGGTATSAAMGGGLMNLLANEMNPAILPIIAANPHNILDPGTAAAGYARGLMSEEFSRDDAAKGGMNGDRWQVLVDAARAHPSPAELQDLLNRQNVDIHVALELMQRNGFTEREANLILGLRHYLLSPPDLAAMWNRSIISTEEGRRLAALSGMSAQDFDRMIELGGEPPGPQSLAEGYRRGFITREQYNRGIVQGPIRNEWFDLLEKLSYSRMSTPDAADAVNQGHLTLAQGEEIARANGLEPQDFAILIESAGLPPGIQLAQEAWLRGFITEAQFDQMFLESRIKNRYLDLLKRSRFNLIPQETVRLLYRNGVYPRDKALTVLQQHGYTAEDAAAMISLEETRQADSTKELTISQVRQLYADRAISRDDAMAMLKAIGYSEDNATFVLELGDLARIQRYITAAVTRVHASYVAGRIDEDAASSALDRLQIPVDQRDDLLSLWDLERSTVSKGLSAAQLVSAVKKGVMSQDDAIRRLTGQGYGPEDALVLLQLGGAAPIPEV